MLARLIFVLLLLYIAAPVMGQSAMMRPSPSLPSYSADASLHGVFFLDPDLGWACGDRGTILVTVDGGGNWDVVSTGYEGTLRCIHFFTPEKGIALGGRSTSLPNQSEALVLETIDGGRNWKRVDCDLPAFHAAGFMDGENAWAVGDCSARYPSGLYRSSDGGVTWTAAPGVTPGPWLCGAFISAHENILAGYESIAARTTAKGFAPIDLAILNPSAFRTATTLEHGQVIFGGDRGMLYRVRRGKAPQKLAPNGKAATQIDFYASASIGEQIWLAGSPGTAVYHSADAGENWKTYSTGQVTPIRAMQFLDADRGFAVGDLGLILTTRNGGETWRVLRKAGHHAAYLGVFSESRLVPWELIARLSGQEGHHGQVVCLGSRTPTSGAATAAEESMLHRAVTRLGGSGGSVLPDYPLAEMGQAESLATLEAKWRNKVTGASARERLEADLVQQILMWRPEVIFTEMPPSSDGDAASQMLSQAVLSAVAAAARGGSVPASDMLLAPWQVKRVYSVQPGRRGFKTVESGQLATRLGRSLQEAAWPARRQCSANESLAPEYFGLQLLLDHTDNDPARSDVFSGIRIEAGGPRRRVLAEPSGAGVESTARRAARHHEVFKLLREANEVLKPEEIESQRIVKALEGLDADFSAQALFEFGQIAAKRGNRGEAITTWSVLRRELPEHSLTGEVEQRVFSLNHSAEQLWKDKETPTPAYADGKPTETPPNETLSQPDVNARPPREATTVSGNAPNSSSQEVLSLLRSLTRAEAASQFAAAALQRNSADPTLALDFYRSFAKENPDNDLAACANAELWLLSRRGSAPKLTHAWILADKRPYLDGKLDDPIWNENKMRLTSNRRALAGRHVGSECWIARDAEFLYFAARCPTRSTAKQRPSPRRDDDNNRDDRVELLLDIDRDWGTFFRLAVCEDGSTLDSCGGDKSWNPKWFVAVSREEGAWTAECAIPLAALAPYPPEKGDAWGLGIQRRAPDKPLESWTHPAKATIHAPGFGLLLTE